MISQQSTPTEKLKYYEGQEIALSWARELLNGKFEEGRHAELIDKRIRELRNMIKNIKATHNL